MTVPRIAIIGAGMAGLACASRLAAAGLSPRVFDKGRGIGGRLATRRAGEGRQFDHGAQYLSARSDEFRAVLDKICGAGAGAFWEDGSREHHVVGVPGMSALAKHLGQGLEITQLAEVTAVRKVGGGWLVAFGETSETFDKVVLATPAPQTRALLGPDHAVTKTIGAASFDPCLTLMVAFAPGQPAPFVTRRDGDDPIAWIALDSSKPGRGSEACWVAQAGPAWSHEHLEADKEEIARRMIPLVCDRLGADPAAITHAAAHRWRYANVSQPFGRPFASSDDQTLFAGGDWCLGPRVESAWTSGMAIADALLERD
ncbi:MAG: FAD-dependent oxidoreductase [Pseudomonadota bacterium]